MIELVSADDPEIVLLQELPVWALARLEGWSRMRSFPAVARRPLVRGPVPGWVTRLHQGRIRSAFVGQANAILVSPSLDAVDLGSKRISGRGRERRVVHAVRVGGRYVVANLHASHAPGPPEVVHEEIERARAFVEGLARPEDVVVLAGDFNLADPALPGYASPAAGVVDHVLVRGAAAEPVVWPVERRTVDGVVLSDHAPVEATVE